jgi:hypothetical protein
MRTAYTILTEIPEENSPLGRSRYKWDNINMDLKYCQMVWLGFISRRMKNIGAIFSTG